MIAKLLTVAAVIEMLQKEPQDAVLVSHLDLDGSFDRDEVYPVLAVVDPEDRDDDGRQYRVLACNQLTVQEILDERKDSSL